MLKALKAIKCWFAGWAELPINKLIKWFGDTRPEIDIGISKRAIAKTRLIKFAKIIEVGIIVLGNF